MRQPAGIFQAGPEKNFVVLRIDLPGDQGYHVIYHEYVHMLVRINLGRLPLWLSEGMAEFFGQATISEGKSGLGRPSEEQLAILKETRLLPLEVLMAVDHESPYYHEAEKTRIFYAQSWALTHYLMIGDERAHAKQLYDFIDLILRHVPETEAITRAFGDLKVMQQKLDQYVRSMGFYYFNVTTRLSVREDQYTARSLSQPEMLAARGDLFVHTNRLEEAQAVLEEALRLDSRSTTANEGMGQLCLMRQDYARAQKYFAVAADLDSGSYLAQYYAARAAWEQGSEDQAGNAEAYLRKAIAIHPQFVPAYSMLSSILIHNEAKRAEALEMARKAAELEPGEVRHQIHVGRILLAMDKVEEAQTIGQRALASAHTDADRMDADSLLSAVTRRQKLLLEAQRRTEAQMARAKEMEQQLRAAETAAAQPAKTTPSIPTGPAAKARGWIRAVKCEFPAVMDIVLESDGKQVKLRAENYFEVKFAAAGKPGRNNFQPCSELEGKLVLVEYLTVSNQEFTGLIQSILIENEKK
jgi:tetratricopeptide (TPR) repeat protein